MIRLEICESREVWDSFVLEQGGHPLQLWGWAQVKESHGWACDRFFGFDEDNRVIALSVLTRKLPLPFRAISYGPRGPVGDVNYRSEFLDLVADHIKKNRNSVALTIEPDETSFNAPEGWVQSQNTILAPSTIQLNLEKKESELLAAMAKKTRQYIRKSSADVDIRRVRSREELSQCIDIYLETAKRAGFSLHSMDYYTDVFNNLGDNSIVYAALRDGKPVAFLWLAISIKTAYELYGGMNEVGAEMRANYALKWHAIKECKKWGIELYDFGGIIDTGVSTFKKNWADDETVMAGSYDKPLSPLYKTWTQLLPKAKRTLQKIKKITKR
jgi:lipid II:glycine glycyltransferase (peptidoglycan interpeptide bridge formation enzyme)